MQFKDFFSGHAADYKTFRPAYPPALFEYLASLAPGHERAWDCATGNGQAALALAPYFRHVVATDASREQIAQAKQAPGVEYVVAPAEQSNIASGTVDLVVVAQALHWFDIPRFFAEVNRVAKPGGVVACWCYGLMTVRPDIDTLTLRLYDDILGPYWPPERRLVEERYRTISFPFIELSPPAFQMEQRWDLEQMVGYLGTWSSSRNYQRANGVDPLTLIGDELLTAWGDPADAKHVVWPLHLRVGKVGINRQPHQAPNKKATE